ncbi:MAG: hypothetical protein ACYSO4_00130, partial [Planctomycetota bacterium]
SAALAKGPKEGKGNKGGGKGKPSTVTEVAEKAKGKAPKEAAEKEHKAAKEKAEKQAKAAKEKAEKDAEGAKEKAEKRAEEAREKAEKAKEKSEEEAEVAREKAEESEKKVKARKDKEKVWAGTNRPQHGLNSLSMSPKSMKNEKHGWPKCSRSPRAKVMKRPLGEFKNSSIGNRAAMIKNTSA